MKEREIIEAQLGRVMRAPSTAKTRCHLALPIVVDVPPVLEDGTPFPTRFWLTCPLAHRRIARLEEAGGVRAWDARLREEPELRAALDKAHAAYAKERDALVPVDAVRGPTGGVAGITGDGVKCLHTHFAHHMAGGDNPVGADVAARIGPLRCVVPCVAESNGAVARNVAWSEPEP